MIFSFDNSVIPTTFQTLWFLSKPSMNLTKAILYVMTFFFSGTLKYVFVFWQFDYDMFRCDFLWVYFTLNLFLYLLLIRNLLIIISSNTLPASLFLSPCSEAHIVFASGMLIGIPKVSETLFFKFIFIPQIWEFKLICFQVHYFLKPVQWQDTSCVHYVNSLPGGRLKFHMLTV